MILYDAMQVASAADRRFPAHQLTSEQATRHCRRVIWQATAGTPDDARDAAEGTRPLFSTSETASTASATLPERGMSKSFLRSSSSQAPSADGKARYLDIGDDRPHACHGCMYMQGRYSRARMQNGQTGSMVYRF